jgi:hypothetical protein
VACAGPDVLRRLGVSADTADWKASSAACLARADAVVLAPGTTRPPPRAMPYLVSGGGPATVFALSNTWRVPGLRAWVAARLDPVPVAV